LRIADSFEPPLRSTLSTPLARGERLLGVLTGYSSKPEAFREEHLYAFEHVGAGLTAILERGDAATATITPFRRIRK
jgi:GAF domain-containing protein